MPAAVGQADMLAGPLHRLAQRPRAKFDVRFSRRLQVNCAALKSKRAKSEVCPIPTSY